MDQISDGLTSFSFSSIHPLMLLSIPQKAGWQIYRPKLCAGCRQLLSNPQRAQGIPRFVFFGAPYTKALSTISAFLGNTSYKDDSSVGGQEWVL